MSYSLATRSASAPWSKREARHLLNRAGFGIPRSSLSHLIKVGHSPSVELFLNHERIGKRQQHAPVKSPVIDRELFRKELMDLPREERQMMVRKIFKEARQEVQELQSWWLDSMRDTPSPLQEKMVLFWHSHFATSAKKVKDAEFNQELNQIFRENATGNFKTLVFEVGKSPAMLNYLNNKQNRKGRPNENWARELMELFTLGIGNYTEEDIKEAARAFTGYTEVNGEFKFISQQHDYGPKRFLGHEGDLDGRDIIDIIFEQEATSRFISRKLWEYFVYESPDSNLVEELAQTLRENNYELRPLLHQIFMSEEFYSDHVIATQIKSPVQFWLMLEDQLGIQNPEPYLVRMALKGLGQELFYPPNVKGWEGGQAWINTDTVLLRQNIPAYILSGRRVVQEVEMDLDEVQPSRAALREKRRQQRIEKRAYDLSGFKAGLSGKSPVDCINELCAHFLSRELTSAQKSLLYQSLFGKKDEQQTVKANDLNEDQLRASLHLLLSLPEYQLC